MTPGPGRPTEPPAADRYLVARIREALTKDPRVNELELEVTVSGGRVFVAGTVATQDRQRAVADVVRELAPDLDIRNATEVTAATAPPRVETLE
jgi:osmotically-inducible protein OsmY